MRELHTRRISGSWVFEIIAAPDVNWVDGPHWVHTLTDQGDTDPAWGQWQGGMDGAMNVTWLQSTHVASFNVKVTGKITCGNGGGGGPIDIEAEWFGNVKNKDWDTGTAIGEEFHEDGTTTKNGRIIKPQDWRVDPPAPPIVLVDPGETVDFEIETATDYDHWTKGDQEKSEKDTVDSYTWEVLNGGTLTPSDGKGKAVTWKAPDQGGPYLIKCTVEDEPNPIKEDEGEEGDRDDAPLIRQMQVKVASWEIDFDKENPKACAGHVDDSVHKFTVTATLTREGVAVPNHAITLYFEGNKGDKHKASFVTGSQNSGDDLTQQIHLTTDANGEASFTVLSSDTITSSIKIKAKYTAAGGQEIPLDGQVTCNFEAAESLRGFQLDAEVSSFPSDPDNGWWFNPDVLISGGDQTTAKIYLKYKKDENWDPVDGHQMKITIGDVIVKSGYTHLDDKGIYTYFVNSDGTPIMKNGEPQGYAIATTETTDLDEDGTIEENEKGVATVYLKGGPLVYQAKTIPLKAEDQTQVK